MTKTAVVEARLPGRFSPATRAWFAAAFEAPTPAQLGAWAAIERGNHALVVAPTGSGKTLAAFLAAIDRLLTAPLPLEPLARCRVLYVSPLKALAADVERNLRSPLVGITAAGVERGEWLADVRVGVRTGDTPASERRSFATKPPDVFITTPESLFLVLTSQARQALRSVETVIIDEVHALAGTKRGAHLALSLERLDALTSGPAQRIALSATVRPVEEVARYVRGAGTSAQGAPRPAIEIVQPPSSKRIEVEVRLPVPDLADLGGPVVGADGEVDLTGDAAGERATASIWPHVHQAILTEILAHRSTLVFANSRRGAERLTTRINESWAEHETGQAPDLDGLGSTLNTAQSGTAAGPAGKAWDYFGSHNTARGQLADADGLVDVLARAHHGSMSRLQRTIIENELKAGLLPAVVATSSLELGIDMGAIDVVLQVGAPPSVASGLQRVGRAGHQVGAVSRGIVYPTYRGDLVPAAVTAQRMRAGAIEAITVPANPLDVLAQQIVAILAMDTLSVEALADLVRGAASFETLGERSFEAVLDMLSGRYPSTDFGELRPRIIWDRATGELTARPGAARLAVTSGGTIPDRGLYGVFLAQGSDDPTDHKRGGKRVGELDEEMVYESRVGDTFTLGSTTWRIVDITPNAVLVVPAPGLPGRLPFWKGDGPGRPAELGQAIGAFIRQVGGLLDDDAGASALMRSEGMDEWAGQNLLDYLREQHQALGALPDDRTIVVERYLDELGDWRLAVHSPWGSRVNGPWAAVLSAQLRERYGLDAQVMHSDDGIMLRLPETAEEDTVGAVDIVLDPDGVTEAVTAALGGSAHFAARFREAAARSLLLPRRRPDRRQPLWQQRHRAAQLLGVASQYADFPIIHEAVRECLQDDYDVPALTNLMRAIAARQVRLVEVRTPSASPFAQTLSFGYTAQFLYDTDAPLAERRAAALSLDPQMLAELLGQSSGTAIADLLDPTVILELDAELAWRTPERRPRNAEHLADMLRSLGPLTPAQIAAAAAAGESEGTTQSPAADVALGDLSPDRADASRADLTDWLPGGLNPPDLLAPVTEPTDAARNPAADAARLTQTWVETLVSARRAIIVRIGGVETVAAIQDAAALRDGLGIALPLGIPTEFLAPQAEPLAALVRRFARHHGPFTAAGLARELGIGQQVAERELAALVSVGALTRGLLRPVEAGGDGSPDYCDNDILTRLKRRSLAVLRRQVEPVEQRALGAFAPRWHQIGRLRGAEGVLQTVAQLGGAALPASAIESLVLPARVTDYQPAMLDELITSGDIVWIGQGQAGGDASKKADGTIRLLACGTDDICLAQVEAPPPDPLSLGLLRILQEGGAYLVDELSVRLHDPAEATHQTIDPGDLRQALWKLVWNGWATGDSFAPVRAWLAGGKTAHRTQTRRQVRPILGRRVAAPPGLMAGSAGMAGSARITPSAGIAGSAGMAPPAGIAQPFGTGASAGMTASAAMGQAAWTRPAGGPRFAGQSWTSRTRDPRLAGRWALAPSPAANGVDISPEQLRMAQVSAMLERYGILTRGAVAIETSFAAVYPVLAGLEERGAVRRGYFIEHLGGSQFALPPCPDLLRAAHDADDAVLLAAADPANPYGAALAWPAHSAAHRPGRGAGAHVVLVGGELVLYVERGGHSALSFVEGKVLDRAAAKLVEGVKAGALAGLTISRVDGVEALAAQHDLHPLAQALIQAGFAVTPTGLKLRSRP